MERVKTLLRNLTTDDLREWAGAKIFNRGKSYIGNVSGLSRTEDGALAAWVSGSDEYATTVGLDPDGDLEYLCTCPYDGGPCKHAVAVLLAAAEQVKRNREIPLLDEDDDLYLELFDDTDDDDYGGDDDWQDEDEEPEVPRKGAGATNRGSNKAGKIVEKLSKEELVEMLVDLSGRYPEIERGILEKEQLTTGRVDKLVSSLRREIRKLTDEPAWHNHWNGEGSLPDYSHVLEQLKALSATGHADAVLELGEELWSWGNEQVAESHDEGEAASGIAECLEVVLRALPQTSLTPPEQLLWVIDRMLEDEYSLLDSGDKILGRSAYTPTDWGAVADSLEARLKSLSKPVSIGFSERYRRGKLVDAVINAYKRSRQGKQVIPLLENEADACQNYGKLVDALLSAGERVKARQWCIVGFGRSVKDAPGIAANLRERLREMALAEKSLDLVAAYRAEEFLDHPSPGAFTELRKAAEKAKVWSKVREGILRYLETGQRPDSDVPGKKEKSWPLPVPEVMAPREKAAQLGRERFPDQELLIDIAIQEKRFSDVVELHGELCKTKRWHFETDKSVAQAVAGSHPQVALVIWRSIVDSLIGQVKPKAYEEAATYLRRMCQVYQESCRGAEWNGLLGELRREHKAKRRLLEVLDGLSRKGGLANRPLV